MNDGLCLARPPSGRRVNAVHELMARVGLIEFISYVGVVQLERVKCDVEVRVRSALASHASIDQ